MNISEDKLGDFKLLSLSGELDANTAPDLETKVLGLIDGGETKLLIDCASLSYVSSAGLRVFLRAAKKMTRAQGKLGLVGVQELVRDVFIMAGFGDMFSFFPSQEEAVTGLA